MLKEQILFAFLFNIWHEIINKKDLNIFQSFKYISICCYQYSIFNFCIFIIFLIIYDQINYPRITHSSYKQFFQPTFLYYELSF